jgi:hypothetical protein
MLRSIRPKRARVVLQTLPNRSEKPPGRPTPAPASASGPCGGPARLLGLVDHAHAAPPEFAQDLTAGDRPVAVVMPGPALPEELVILRK